MRRVAAENAPFAEGLCHQPDISLLQVPDTAVDKLCRARRSPFCKVIFFQEKGTVSARRRVDGDAKPGGPAPDNAEIPLPAAFCFQGTKHIVAVHHITVTVCLYSSVQAIAVLIARRHPFINRSTCCVSIRGLKRRSTAHWSFNSSTELQKPDPRPAR